MVKKEVDWAALRCAYENGEGSYRALGERFGISSTRIAQKAKQDGWGGRKREQTDAAQRWLCEAAQDLCAEARDAIRESRGEKPSVKELKEMAAVLKDLVALQQTLGGKAETEDRCLRIVMEDEVARWSE